jgi:hypothetical protein
MRSAKENYHKHVKDDRLSLSWKKDKDKEEIAALCRPFPSYLANLG